MHSYIIVVIKDVVGVRDSFIMPFAFCPIVVFLFDLNAPAFIFEFSIYDYFIRALLGKISIHLMKGNLNQYPLNLTI